MKKQKAKEFVNAEEYGELWIFTMLGVLHVYNTYQQI
tara:strand:- start:219 stop:329 length:111 start_codon:yes stop_codon:yes gene_type:complete